MKRPKPCFLSQALTAISPTGSPHWIWIEVLLPDGTPWSGIEPLLVGSVAKDTYLKEPDLDVFMLFDPATPRDDLKRMGLDIGRRVLPDGEERYAEHPYIHGFFEGLEVDLVPCYRIVDGSQKMSAVDRTPFHTRYVSENMEPGQRVSCVIPQWVRIFESGMSHSSIRNRTSLASADIWSALGGAWSKLPTRQMPIP